MNPDYAPLANGAIYQQMKDGDELTIGGWLTVNCVGPETVKNSGNQNMDSLNFVLIYGQKRMLFTGDYAASGNINRKYQDLVRNIDVLKFPHHGILDDKTNTYEIGVVLMRVLSPTYVLIPGAASVWEIWNFIAAYSAEQNLTRDHVYNNRFGNIVLLTDGETIEVCTNVDPADFNPYQPEWQNPLPANEGAGFLCINRLSCRNREEGTCPASGCSCGKSAHETSESRTTAAG